MINDNIDAFIHNTGLKKDEANELFTDFISYLPKHLEALKDFIAQKDFEKVSKLAHGLKGSSGNLRITSIYELAVLLEEAAIRQDKEACERIFMEIQALFH